MTTPAGRHRAPEPVSPTSSSGLGPVVAFFAVATVVSLIVGPFWYGGWALAVVFFLFMLLILRFATPVSPRTKRELTYAGRTAERAGIFWVVFRALNGIFR